MGKKHDRLVEELGQYVRDRFEIAKDTKREQYDILLDCLRQVRGELLACEALDPDIDVNFNITSPIVKGIVVSFVMYLLTRLRTRLLLRQLRKQT